MGRAKVCELRRDLPSALHMVTEVGVDGSRSDIYPPSVLHMVAEVGVHCVHCASILQAAGIDPDGLILGVM